MSSQANAEAASRQDVKAARQEMEQGRKAERKLDRWAAIEHYRKAFEHASEEPEVCFRLAYQLDLVGEEEEARDLYEQCCASAEATPINALLNLATLYEDAGEYERAERCLKMVVETDPNHERARLHLKDVQASRSMFVDEQAGRAAAEEQALLETPISGFDLSDRAQTGLQQMNVHTLGDLTRLDEAELRSSEGLGEATVLEIKNLLAQHHLELGQESARQQQDARQQVYQQLQESADPQALDALSRPIEDLNLSARARKALGLLEINTIGELVSRTEEELLGIKNFGQTSLEEIKEKLTEHGLTLRKIDDQQQG